MGSRTLGTLSHGYTARSSRRGGSLRGPRGSAGGVSRLAPRTADAHTLGRAAKSMIPSIQAAAAALIRENRKPETAPRPAARKESDAVCAARGDKSGAHRARRRVRSVATRADFKLSRRGVSPILLQQHARLSSRAVNAATPLLTCPRACREATSTTQPCPRARGLAGAAPR